MRKISGKHPGVKQWGTSNDSGEQIIPPLAQGIGLKEMHSNMVKGKVVDCKYHTRDINPDIVGVAITKLTKEMKTNLS